MPQITFSVPLILAWEEKKYIFQHIKNIFLAYENMKLWKYEIMKLWNYEIMKIWKYEIMKIWKYENMKIWTYEHIIISKVKTYCITCFKRVLFYRLNFQLRQIKLKHLNKK